MARLKCTIRLPLPILLVFFLNYAETHISLLIAVEDVLRAVNIRISTAYRVRLLIEQLMVILSAKMMDEVERGYKACEWQGMEGLWGEDV
jgi:hypothetical protein